MRITVFLGSRLPDNPIFKEAIVNFGKAIANDSHTLVYGGARSGTMGLLADTCLEHGAEVIGVMPEVLSSKEMIHPHLNELILVENMAKRKELLESMGDIFIAMPGGAGTMDEIFEVITNKQIGLHNKPTCFININGFYNGIKQYLDDAVSNGFMSDDVYHSIYFFNSLKQLIDSKLYCSLG